MPPGRACEMRCAVASSGYSYRCELTRPGNAFIPRTRKGRAGGQPPDRAPYPRERSAPLARWACKTGMERQGYGSGGRPLAGGYPATVHDAGPGARGTVQRMQLGGEHAVASGVTQGQARISGPGLLRHVLEARIARPRACSATADLPRSRRPRERLVLDDSPLGPAREASLIPRRPRGPRRPGRPRPAARPPCPLSLPPYPATMTTTGPTSRLSSIRCFRYLTSRLPSSRSFCALTPDTHQDHALQGMVPAGVCSPA